MVGLNGSTQPSSRPRPRDDMKWMEFGACQNRDDDGKIFFPEPGNNAIPAKKMCSGCPVRIQCLNWSLETRQMYGVWGGVAEKKRRKMMQLRYGRTPYYTTVEEDDDVSTSAVVGRS